MNPPEPAHPGERVVDLGAHDIRSPNGRLAPPPFPDGQADVVFSDPAHHAPADTPHVLAEAYRVLRPGGRLALTDVPADDHRTHLLTAGFTHPRITPTAGTAHLRATKPPAPHGYSLRPMRAADARQVLDLYRLGIEEGEATFETEPPTWEQFDAAKLPLHRYVAVEHPDGPVAGWTAAAPTSTRFAYAGVVEHSVYVAPPARGTGIAGALLKALIASTEAAGIWTVQSSVFPENTASLKLHEHTGFRRIGHRERVAQHHGTWRDTILLERRSPHIN